MEERRAHGFRVRPSYSQVLGYIAEGEPLPITYPNRNASILTSSHFWLQDLPESTEPEPAPLPHTTVDPAAAYEDANEGYDGVPFPRRDFLRPRAFDSDSDFGAVDPGQALRNDGFQPPPAPGFLGRLQQAEAAAGAAAGLAGSASAIAGHGADLYNAARRGAQLDRPEPAHPPRARGPGAPARRGRSTTSDRQERAAARDIEQFMSQQMAEAPEAEATEGFASAAEAAAGAAEAAATAEAGGGALAAIGSGLAAAGEAALPVAATVGAAAGGLAVAGAGAALVGTAWALHGGMVAAEHLMGWGGGGGTDTDASSRSSVPDVRTLNAMQEFGAEQHFQLREPRTQYYRMDTEDEEPRAQPPPRAQARPARPTRYPTGLNSVAQSSGSDSSRGPRMQRQASGRSRAAPPPSFEALRSASEPEAA